MQWNWNIYISMYSDGYMLDSLTGNGKNYQLVNDDTNMYRISSDMELTANYVQTIHLSVTADESSCISNNYITSVDVPVGGSVKAFDQNYYSDCNVSLYVYAADGRNVVTYGMGSIDTSQRAMDGLNYDGQEYGLYDRIYISNAATELQYRTVGYKQITFSTGEFGTQKILKVPVGGGVIPQYNSLYGVPKSVIEEYRDNKNLVLNCNSSDSNRVSFSDLYREGYVFDGWGYEGASSVIAPEKIAYTESDGDDTWTDYQYILLNNVSEDITMVPFWKKLKSLTINGNGGTFSYSRNIWNLNSLYGYSYNRTVNVADANSITVYYEDDEEGNPCFNAWFNSTNDYTGYINTFINNYQDNTRVTDYENGNKLLAAFNTSADGSGTKLDTSLDEIYTYEDDEDSYTDSRTYKFQDGDTVYAIWKNRKTLSLFQDESVLEEGNESEEFQSIATPEGADISLNTLYSISVTYDGIDWTNRSISVEEPDHKILVGWKQILGEGSEKIIRWGERITDAVTGIISDLNLFGVYKDEKVIPINPGEGASFASGDASIVAPVDGEIALYVGGNNSASINVASYDVDGEKSYLVSSCMTSAYKPGYVYSGIKANDQVITYPYGIKLAASNVDSLEILWEEGNVVRYSYDVVARANPASRFSNNDQHTVAKSQSAYFTVQKDEDGDYYAAYFDNNKNEQTINYLNTMIWGMGQVASDYVAFNADGKSYNLGELAPVTNNMLVTLQTTPAQAAPAQAAPAQTQPVVTPPAPVVVYPSSVTLSANDLVLTKGETVQLFANVAPANANDLSVSYASDDNKVATVDANGVITAKAGGSATITVTTSNGIKAYCEVHVATIKLNASSTKLQTKHTTTALEVESKSYSKDSIASVSSSDEKIVKASFKGSKITLKSGSKSGKAKVTVTMKSGATASCTVYVQKGKVVTTKLTINESNVTILTKKSIQLEAERNPITATEKITWSSSDTSIATVNSKGKVTAKKSGKVTITAKTSNGKKDTCKIIVKNPEVKLRKTSGTVKVKKTLQIQIKSMFPVNDSVKSYKSSNTKVAKVNSDGTVLGVKKGSATITVTMESGAKATFKVKVKK